ncbi:hypothetical protein [Paenibacillus konkukensis]|uniref:hypothetical protein n=1 Tax=Paenibacillus konkukensis TaxID=2020716 RepID=UPI00201E2F1A|nr:hypothetical protein [Paenibacillus konkukensis]
MKSNHDWNVLFGAEIAPESLLMAAERSNHDYYIGRLRDGWISVMSVPTKILETLDLMDCGEALSTFESILNIPLQIKADWFMYDHMIEAQI